MDSNQQSRRIEQARRRMRLVSLAAIPVELAAVVGLYFIAPVSEVVAVGALLLVGGGAAVAADRKMGAIATGANARPNARDAPRPIGRRKAKQIFGLVIGLYLTFAVAGGVIGQYAVGGESAVVVGGVSGLFVGYALTLTVLRSYKRRRHGSSTSE